MDDHSAVELDSRGPGIACLMRPKSRMPRFPPRIFLLSPARLDGKRAHLLFHPVTMFPVARALHSTAGAPIGEIFTFLSGLYFRGKLAYAEAFARPPRRARIRSVRDHA